MYKKLNETEMIFQHVPEADLFQMLLLPHGEQYKHYIFENYTNIGFYIEPDGRKKFKFSDISKWSNFDCLDFCIMSQQETLKYPLKETINELISQDYSIYLCADTFEIPQYETYHENHSIHDCILCGIDDDKVLCYDYYDFLKPEFIEISLEDLCNGFKQMQPVTYEPVNERYRRPDFASLKLKKDYFRAPDMEKIKQDLKNGEQKKLTYLLTHIEHVIEKKEDIYIKHFNFLFSYFKVTNEKMKFFGWWKQEYQKHENWANILLFKALKYTVLQKFDEGRLLEIHNLAKEIISQFDKEIERTICQNLI